MFVMKSFPLLLIANFLYGSAMSSSAIFGGSRSVPSSKRLTDRALPPLVPPKLVEDDEDFDERDLDLSPAHHVQLRPSYWAPTLETLAPEEAEFYRKALVSAMIGARPQMKRGEAGRSMSMLRMGRASDGGVRRRSTSTDGVRRSMTMLRMGRASFDQDQQQQQEEEEEAAAKRSMGMLRMGRGATTEEDFRKSMSMLRMGRGAMLDEDSEDLLHQQQQMKRSMGMLRMGRSLGRSQEEEDAAEEESKRSMGMLRMGRALASKNVDRGALNMLRMGKREAMADDQIGSSSASGVAAAADKSSSSS